MSTTTTTMTEGTIRVGGQDLFFAETGEGAPVLLLHGGGPGASGLPNPGGSS
jgi:hypothetical protein